MPRFNLSREDANAIEQTQPLVLYILRQLPTPEQEVLERLFFVGQEVSDIAADDSFSLPEGLATAKEGEDAEISPVLPELSERERGIVRLRERALVQFAHHLHQAGHKADATKARYLLRANGFYERNRSYPPLTDEEKAAVEKAFNKRLAEVFGEEDIRADVEPDQRLEGFDAKKRSRFALLFLLQALKLRTVRRRRIASSGLLSGSPEIETVPTPTTREEAEKFAEAVFRLTTDDDNYRSLELELTTGPVLDISCSSGPEPEDEELIIQGIQHPDRGNIEDYVVYLTPKDAEEPQAFTSNASGVARIPLSRVSEAIYTTGLEFRIEHGRR